MCINVCVLTMYIYLCLKIHTCACTTLYSWGHVCAFYNQLMSDGLHPQCDNWNNLCLSLAVTGVWEPSTLSRVCVCISLMYISHTFIPSDLKVPVYTQCMTLLSYMHICLRIAYTPVCIFCVCVYVGLCACALCVSLLRESCPQTRSFHGDGGRKLCQAPQQPLLGLSLWVLVCIVLVGGDDVGVLGWRRTSRGHAFINAI